MITDNSLFLLEFHKLLAVISAFAHSEGTKEAVLSIRPFQNREEIETRFGQVQEIRRISQEGNPLKLSSFADISHFLKRARPEGAVLEAIELSAFVPVLSIASEISAQIMENPELPFLRELAGSLTGHPDILKRFRKSIDAEGNILDTASSLLSSLRGRRRRLENNIRKNLEEITRAGKVAVFLQDDFITQRAGRWVIPVRMDSKGQVPGVVHDVSKSGETAFIEPLGILHLSNELENMIAEEKAEEIRILRNLTTQIRERADEIIEDYECIVRFDLLHCIAGFAERMHMQVPLIQASGRIHLVQGRHPLLSQALLKTSPDQRVVPLDVTLGGENTVMVITGSNAGGKTISLKTIGLLLVMALSGMPVPADSSTVFPLVKKLLIDIGDEQSIENSLSTFSAHVSHISEIIQNADEETMALIDELGTGTDPDEGAALSCAVLKEVQQRGALVFATTHLTGIKGFVHRTAGMLNASMEFDQKTLTPLYRMRMGEPGQSHALDIAGKYGLPDRVIDSARELLGGISIEFDNLIADLNEKRARHESALAELADRQVEIERKERELEEKIATTQIKESEILGNAYREASNIVSDLKRQLHLRLEEMKKMDKEKIREEIKQAEKMQKHLQEARRRFERDHGESPKMEEIAKGDILFVRSLGYDATVAEVLPRHDRVRVRAGNMEIEVPVSDTGKKKGLGFSVGKADTRRAGAPDEEIATKINLIGLRVDEALSRLEPFLNHAALAGLQEVTIIHGIGKGLLSRAVRGHLKGHPLVKSYRKCEQTEGGAGVTVATLA
ncbi:MAG: endonuclease MutS2 [Nitrospira bacterium HGW-Nitrospira-1]|nr:MAG: endonuclease MutS2 [Nitrospira bacterium HGW-Nitrospira-1]